MILDALEQDSKSNGNGLTVSELAAIVFGNFHKSTAAFHERKISSYMGAVCEFGAENNLIIFAVKKSTNKKTPDVKSRIVRWRVYVPGQIGATEEFLDALVSKKKCGESHTKSFFRMLAAAKDMGVLVENDLKKFEISLQ